MAELLFPQEFILSRQKTRAEELIGLISQRPSSKRQ